MQTYLYPAVTIALIVLSGALFFRAWRFKRQLMQVTDRIEEIRLGAVNQRIRLAHAPAALNDLGGSMNRLIDGYQRSMEKVNLLESERKKMITHLSHDLRTPLTAILGYIEVMQKDETLPEETRRQYCRIIASRGHKLDALIKDFFELSKLEAGDEPLEREKFNVIDKIQEAVVSFYHQFRLVPLTPELQLPERPVYAWGNRRGLERILNNLLANSLRYGADGGVIGIEVREAGDRVWIEVWDRGQGITTTDLPHIFERLYTGKASRNAAQQGNGLGLTIVKKLVEKQEGEISVSSVPNEKTAFSFCLPKAT